MALDAVKGYLRLASGLGDLTRAKATEAADALLSLSSSMVSTPVASQVASLADEIMAAASANRESLKALVRAEVESAVAHALAAPGGELDRARHTVNRLSTDLEELRGQVLDSPAVRTVTDSGAAAMAALTGQLGRGMSRDVITSRRGTTNRLLRSTEAQQGSSVASPITRNEGSMATKKAAPAKKAVVKKAAPATKTSPAKKTAATKTAATGPPAKTAVARKAATKSVAKKTAPAKTTPAKKATATKSVAKKASPVKKATAAKKTSPAKKTAAKKTPTRKSAAKK